MQAGVVGISTAPASFYTTFCPVDVIFRGSGLAKCDNREFRHRHHPCLAPAASSRLLFTFRVTHFHTLFNFLLPECPILMLYLTLYFQSDPIWSFLGCFTARVPHSYIFFNFLCSECGTLKPFGLLHAKSTPVRVELTIKVA